MLSYLDVFLMTRYFGFRKSWFFVAVISRFRETSISFHRGFMISQNLFVFSFSRNLDFLVSCFLFEILVSCFYISHHS